MAFDKTKAIRAAEKYLAQGKITSAIQEYLRIVESDREDFTALNTLGDLYARVSRRQEAVACYRRVAEHYREQGFALKAIAMYKKVTRFEAADPRTALALAALYEQQGLMADARAQYLAAADAHAAAGDNRASLEALRRIADLDPSDTAVRVRLADGFARHDMPDEAAEAYTAAGERLAARGENQQALDLFDRALAQRPALHAALSGLLGAHVALGTAAEAADVLEHAAGERPRDVELHAMLARAYIEAEDAPRADPATAALVALDPASYTVFFDVARLYLHQANLDEAARVLDRVSEQALNGGQDDLLLEFLQAALERDPEHLAALRLLARVYGWQREDEKLRAALERLADAAQAAGAAGEERQALAQLVRLAPDEPRYAARLDALGGAAPGEDPAPTTHPSDAPSFESFMLEGGAFAAKTAAGADQASGAGGGFAFGREEAGGEIGYNFSAPAADAQLSGFQEIDFGAAAPAQAAGAGAEPMLLQELESVDFYIEQKYADIASETLDMLERQYGPHAEIERRRALLPADALAGLAGAAAPGDGFGASDAFDFTTLAPPPDAAPANGDGGHSWTLGAADDVEAPRPDPANELDQAPPGPPSAAPDAPPPPPAAPAAPAVSAAAPQSSGLDPGLAAIFDEFRDAVEDGEPAGGEDFETHYQMGLAYREMGLLDQAVEEFQAASAMTSAGDGTPRFLSCCNLLGHCFVQKGMPRPAAVWFRKGLDAPGHTEDEYQALRFELGSAYEQMGEIARAVEIFSEVYAIDVTYRGVADRLQELQKAVNRES